MFSVESPRNHRIRPGQSTLPSLAAALVTESPDAVLVIDAYGHCRDANPTACRLLGYTREELLRLSAPDLVFPVVVWPEILQTHLAEGHWRGEIELRRKDDTRVAVAAWSVAIPGPDGQIFVAFLRDLAAQHPGEEDLATTH